MKFKILVIIIAGLFFVQWWCSFGTSNPPYKTNIWVPLHNQECENWCGIACIQMWADLDGVLVTQTTIANYLGVVGSMTPNPYELETGVGHFTCSPGWLERRPWDDPGAQGDLIAASITGIKYGIPSIMPFYNGDHAVLIKGYEWREENGKPVALSCWLNDPRGYENQKISASKLAAYFECFPYDYWVIVGYPEFVWEGIAGHDAFVAAGGTYYGGPLKYDPKDIVPEY